MNYDDRYAPDNHSYLMSIPFLVNVVASIVFTTLLAGVLVNAWFLVILVLPIAHAMIIRYKRKNNYLYGMNFLQRIVVRLWMGLPAESKAVIPNMMDDVRKFSDSELRLIYTKLQRLDKQEKELEKSRTGAVDLLRHYGDSIETLICDRTDEIKWTNDIMKKIEGG